VQLIVIKYDYPVSGSETDLQACGLQDKAQKAHIQLVAAEAQFASLQLQNF